jgi:hypothetical protein
LKTRVLERSEISAHDTTLCNRVTKVTGSTEILLDDYPTFTIQLTQDRFDINTIASRQQNARIPSSSSSFRNGILKTARLMDESEDIALLSLISRGPNLGENE